MSQRFREADLPEAIQQKGDLRGNEWVWRVDDIPEVIEAIAQLGRLSLGGQLQFRTADGICEAYWVDIGLSIQATPQENATEAKHALAELQNKFDFIDEAKSFESLSHLTTAELQNVMWFVWYIA